MLTTNHSRIQIVVLWPQSKLKSPCSSCNQNRFKCQSAETAEKAIALNPRGIWVLSQVVLPGKLGSWLAQAAQELTNPQVWITAPLPCVFSLRGKRLKIRTDTTLDLCDMVMKNRASYTLEIVKIFFFIVLSFWLSFYLSFFIYVFIHFF